MMRLGDVMQAKRRWNPVFRDTDPAVIAELKRSATRFWSKVDTTGTCWIWTAGRSHQGYGQFSVTVAGKKSTIPSHRVAVILTRGPIPLGAVIDHICRIHECVNPDHLRCVTQRTNTRVGVGPSGINARKDRCVNGHQFTAENTYDMPKGNRACRLCRHEADVRYKQKRRAAKQLLASEPSGSER